MDKVLVLKYPIRGNKIVSDKERKERDIEREQVSVSVKKIFGDDWKILMIPEDYNLRIYDGGRI